ncbi:hypothetical protein GALMADRAFT_454000 [Galerina marginata CBS 339.88]|uniref:Uncharacterized protein n=1 Tax=Galerina marginata (strain CBS 339.88) TaxID=685588 RepID=A0A067TA07_GALM3|nr:hypothetical protein GALMADRAFT_454000 [Galerina marginata CBS 339.88]
MYKGLVGDSNGKYLEGFSSAILSSFRGPRAAQSSLLSFHFSRDNSSKPLSSVSPLQRSCTSVLLFSSDFYIYILEIMLRVTRSEPN